MDTLAVLREVTRAGRLGEVSLASGRVRFGTAKTLRLHKNVFPCRIWRVNVMGNTGCTEYDERRRCTKPETLARGIEFAGKGWRAGATLSWVEVRPDDWKPSKPPEVA